MDSLNTIIDYFCRRRRRRLCKEKVPRGAMDSPSLGGPPSECALSCIPLVFLWYAFGNTRNAKFLRGGKGRKPRVVNQRGGIFPGVQGGAFGAALGT